MSLGESRGTKSESLLHTLCYRNRMYKAYAGKDGIVLYFTKAKDDRNQNFKRSLLGYNDKATVKKLQENSLGWEKDGILLPRGAVATP